MEFLSTHVNNDKKMSANKRGVQKLFSKKKNKKKKVEKDPSIKLTVFGPP